MIENPLYSSSLTLPLIVAPMFLSSGPELVTACCRAGVVGTFPAHNQRTTEGFGEWLEAIEGNLAAFERESGCRPAPYGVNLIVHRSNAKLEDELALCVKHEVPIIITSLGAVSDLVDAVHGYGGIVLHDVISLRHARKAAAAGVDGLIAVSAGAGGHTGQANPFALVHEIRAFFDGHIVLSGSLSSGADVAAAQVMGADYAYMGTRFIATRESMSAEEYKDMIVAATAADIVSTKAVTGVNANFIAQSLEKAGIDIDSLPEHGEMDINAELGEALKESNTAKPWRDIWSAGHGVGSVEDVPGVEELVQRLKGEYLEAVEAQRARARAYGGDGC
ncbi:NAD(P)H-dependent flavin oxidoreductase [Alphaproteobacteria bacterium LSUCC0684]